MSFEMSIKITLTETYCDLSFLSKLSVLGQSIGIIPDHARTAATLLKRLKGKNLSPITYDRKLCKINNGGGSDTLGRYWPRNISFVCNQSMIDSLCRVLNAGQCAYIDV